MNLIACVPFAALPKASRQTRKRLKIGVREAAKKARISRATLSRVECGANCDAKTYLRLSKWVLAEHDAYEFSLIKQAA